MRLSAPTYWPMVPAIGLAVIAVCILLEAYLLTILGVAVVIAGLVGWARRLEIDNDESDTAPVGGIYPIEARGWDAVGWWAAVSIVGVLVVGVATIFLSAFFLRVNSGTWTTQSLSAPLLTLAVGLVAVAGLAANWWGARRYHDEDRTATGFYRAHMISAGLAILAGVVALALLLVIWLQAGLDPTAHAFDSSVLLLLAAQGLTVLFALGGNVAAIIARLRQTRDSRPALLLQNSAIVWVAVLVAWAMSWVATDLLPVVVI